VSGTLNSAAAAIVDDTFTKCFKSNAPDPWNWNLYLFPLWVVGCVVRYGILFPVRCATPSRRAIRAQACAGGCACANLDSPSPRLLSLGLGFLVFFAAFFPVHFLAPPGLRASCERRLIKFLAASFVFSWTGVVRYHGAAPALKPRQVFVANHTSMIDFIVLEQSTPFAVIMQKHGGWVGWLQGTVLASLGCIHFNRAEASDRASVSRRIKQHVAAEPANNPLLIFPEGTCVNNEYCCMFKRGAFDLGDDITVCPIAIKYNKIFVDAFWNSRREGFSRHLMRLMTSWALVADVWYLEPQRRAPGESVDAFAERVRGIISERAGLKTVPWDGLLKYYRPSAAMCERQRQAFAERMLRHLDGSATPRKRAPVATPTAAAAAEGQPGARRRLPPLAMPPVREA
jgi:glycerol-3-phosphate O-acyltransferase 3/4